jgi:hypothetical protein
MDLADLDGVTFEVLDAHPSTDWQFDAISAVPEPSTGTVSISRDWLSFSAAANKCG